MFFSLSILVQGSGVAAPLTIVAAMVAMIFQSNSVSQFARVLPSTGSYVTFIGATSGRQGAVIVSLVVAFGYIVAIGSVVAMSGYWTGIIIQKFFDVNIPWPIISALVVALTWWLCVRGVSISTKVTVIVFLFEMGLLLTGAICMLVTQHSFISLAAFNPHNLAGGFKGLALGYPIALYMFIGFANAAPLAEETENPRKNIPLAVYNTVILAGISYIFLAWCGTVGLDNNAALIANSTVPFIDAANKAMGGWAVLVYLGGFTSTLACMLGATNGQARMVFSAAREGVLPKWLAGVTANKHTPFAAITFYLLLSSAIMGIWTGFHNVPLDIYGYLGTLGTLPVILTYVWLDICVPIYYLKHHPDQFNIWLHRILPICSTICMLWPIYGLVEPGQPAPYNYFVGIILAFMAIFVITGFITVKLNPEVGKNIGSVLADEFSESETRFVSKGASINS
jgi:amino acid transporter